MPSPYVDREDDSRKYLREKVKGSDNHLSILKSSPQYCKLVKSLAFDYFAENMRPAIQFQHLDVVQTFTRRVDSGVLLFHENFLEFGLYATKTHIGDESKNENCNSCKETFAQVGKQYNEANHQQKG